jgi:hypothetical protein
MDRSRQELKQDGYLWMEERAAGQLAPPGA